MTAGDVYRPPRSSLALERGIERSRAELAPRGARLAAALLDTAFYSVPALVILWPFLTATTPQERIQIEAWSMYIVVFAVVAAILLILNIILLATRGQTIAKVIVGIRIVKVDRTPAGFVHAFLLRMLVPGLVSAIPYVGIVFGLLDALFIFRDDRRCIHDLIASTIVIGAQPLTTVVTPET